MRYCRSPSGDMPLSTTWKKWGKCTLCSWWGGMLVSRAAIQKDSTGWRISWWKLHAVQQGHTEVQHLGVKMSQTLVSSFQLWMGAWARSAGTTLRRVADRSSTRAPRPEQQWGSIAETGAREQDPPPLLSTHQTTSILLRPVWALQYQALTNPWAQWRAP